MKSLPDAQQRLIEIAEWLENPSISTGLRPQEIASRLRSWAKADWHTPWLGLLIPRRCHYWQYQGDHSMIGCQISGGLCPGTGCSVSKADPTGKLRRNTEYWRLGHRETNGRGDGKA